MTTSLPPRFRPTASPERGARPTVSSGVTEPVPPRTAEDRDGAERWRTSIPRGFSPVPAEFDTLIRGRPQVMVLTTTTTGGPGPAGRPVQIATVPLARPIPDEPPAARTTGLSVVGRRHWAKMYAAGAVGSDLLCGILAAGLAQALRFGTDVVKPEMLALGLFPLLWVLAVFVGHG